MKNFIKLYKSDYYPDVGGTFLLLSIRNNGENCIIEAYYFLCKVSGNYSLGCQIFKSNKSINDSLFSSYIDMLIQINIFPQCSFYFIEKLIGPVVDDNYYFSSKPPSYDEIDLNNLMTFYPQGLERIKKITSDPDLKVYLDTILPITFDVISEPDV